MEVKFSLSVDARPQPRPKFGNGRAYQPAAIVEYKAAIRQAAQVAMNGLPPMEGELQMTIKFCRKFQPQSRRFGDVDNLYKAIADALNGVVYRDDSQVTRALIEKHKGSLPHVEVEVQTMT